ncbi:MAG: 6-bladed beta-propeller [Gemmatimonadales bacterium]|jgi:hypothetical protein
MTAKITILRTRVTWAFVPLFLASCQPETPVSAVLVQWSADRDLRIGSLNARDYILTEVADLAVGRDGTIYVAQPQEQTIRVYDSTGTFLRTIGREGGGPGEFYRPIRLGWKADTLWVRDPAAQRMSMFAADGTFITSISFPVLLHSLYLDWVGPSYLLADGTVLSVPHVRTRAVADGSVTHLPWLRLSREGEVLDTLLRQSMLHTTAQVHDPLGRGRQYIRQRFSDAPLVDLAPDGSELVVVDRRVDARDPTYTVTALSPAGDTILHRGYRYSPVPFDQEAQESWIAEFVERRRRLGLLTPTLERALRRAVYVPEHTVPVTALVAGRDGTTWLRGPETDPGLASWTVLGTDGTKLASIDIPTGVRVYQADRNFIWGIEHDTLDVPYVVRLRVR